MSLNLKDKIRGSLMGYAIGDTLGKGTEFMTAQEAEVRYPGGLRDYSQIIRDAHRSQWGRSDFTLDTEIVLRLAECIMKSGIATPQDFARTLKEWYDIAPYDMDSHLRLVAREPDFTTDPIGVCRKVTESMGNYEASNEALGRAMLLGTCKDDHSRKIAENCRTTHYDTRCVSSALVIGEMAHRLVWDDCEADYDDLVDIAAQVDERTVPYIETAYNGDLDDFDLDDGATYWYTRKTMGAALWALWHVEDPEEALYAIVDSGGDANTNASLTLGLMGLKYGIGAIPTHHGDKLRQHDRVDDTACRWADFLATFI